MLAQAITTMTKTTDSATPTKRCSPDREMATAAATAATRRLSPNMPEPGHTASNAPSKINTHTHSQKLIVRLTGAHLDSDPKMRELRHCTRRGPASEVASSPLFSISSTSQSDRCGLKSCITIATEPTSFGENACLLCIPATRFSHLWFTRIAMVDACEDEQTALLRKQLRLALTCNPASDGG